jgi:competence protein ComGC
VLERPLGTEIETVRPPEPKPPSPHKKPTALPPRGHGAPHPADLSKPRGQGREVPLPPPSMRRNQSRSPLVRVGVGATLLLILIVLFISLVLKLLPPPNKPPMASKYTVTINEDTAKLVPLHAKDADKDSLTYKITSLPSNGKLYKGDSTAANKVIRGNTTLSGKQVTYMPYANYIGSDSFEFRANDGNGGIDTAPVRVKVTHGLDNFDRILGTL